ncbi:MAG: sugar phosphate isomerase/epimerase [Pirellulales bacterium]|nr:sugar phosphate isomerase/epimerase [Pirellulales bacterium]
MQLGFVSAILPDLSLEEVLNFAATEDYDCVEVMCWPAGKAERKFAGVTHIDVEDFSQTAADDVRGLCDKYDIGISGLGYYPNPLSKDADEAAVARNHLKKVIDAAPRLGLDTVNTFIGADWTQPMATNLNQFRAVWPALIQYAEDRGVRIGIENCPMLFSLDEWPFGKNLARSPDVWRKMFDAIPSKNFGLNYDPSHMILQRMDCYAPIKEFGPRIVHTHAKDMKIELDELNDRGVLTFDWGTPKIPGLGDIDWSRWISALTDIGYNGPVCVEVEDNAFMESLETRKQSLRISRNVLRPLIGGN